MNIKLKKAYRDLRSDPGRTALVILALIIGLWGVGSILVSYTILSNDLNENFKRTNPAQAVLTSKDFGRLDISAFRMRPEIESAEFRDLSLERIEVSRDEWIPLYLFGVEDFNDFNLARFSTEKGNGVPVPGAMLIERNGLLISNLKVGSSPRIRSGQKTFHVPVTGIVFDAAQAPATQDHMIYGYVDKATYAAISGNNSGQRLILRVKYAKSKAEVQRAVNAILSFFQSQQITVSTVNIPQFNEHPHQWQLNTLLFLQGSIGLLAFLMGAALVSQLMSAILARQVRQIGILKAIGASRFRVFQIYGTMVLILGVAAGMIAVPLAVTSGYAFAKFVSFKLNFEVLTTRLPIQIYCYLAAAGLALPAVLSLPALLRGTTISVTEALSDYGIRGSLPGGKSSVMVGRFLPRSFVMALKNTMRQKRRLAVTVLTMALGVAIFSTGFNVRQSLKNLLSDVKSGMKHDVQVVLKGQVPLEMALSPFKSIANVKLIEPWNGGKGVLQSQEVATADGVGIVALPYDSDLVNLRIVAGRWLKRSEETEVVMNQQAMELYGDPAIGGHRILKVGEKLLQVRLVGVVEEFDKAKIYIDKRQYDGLVNPDHLVNSLMFVVNNSSDGKISDLKKEIENRLAASSLSVLSVISQEERVKIIYDHLSIILTVIIFLALVVLIVSSLGMASATSINIMERTREIGVLRAVGATPQMIYTIFVSEGMIVSAAGILLGLILARPLSGAASGFFGNLLLGNGAVLRYAFSTGGFWITLLTTLLFGWLASRIPARRAVRVSTREALSYE